MELKFRTLTPEEIECKPTIVGPKIEVSLHVKAYVCTMLLNETVGAMGWEKEYTNGNKNCIVRIWDKEANRMISKEDCGGPLTEIDGHKGQASNGFKRVCALGWGLGIELYSQPKILLNKNDNNITYNDKGNAIVCEEYSVQKIEYDECKRITRCVIVDSQNRVVYDGPDESGKSRVEFIEPEEEPLVIPPDEEEIEDDVIEDVESQANHMMSGDDDDIDDVLPDNTDGYEKEEFDTQKPPFSEEPERIDYAKQYAQEFDTEIARTKVKRGDVLKVLGIESFDQLDTVDTDKVVATLNKLKAMPTYKK